MKSKTTQAAARATVKKATKQDATKAGIRFAYPAAPDAKSVSLVGDFNGWDPAAHRMSKRAGMFVRRMQLEPGEYEYKFVVDGRWELDPLAPHFVPNGLGTLNSVVVV